MTVTYRVFLPPSLTLLDEVGPSDLPIVFRAVSRPVGFESLSQSAGWKRGGGRPLDRAQDQDRLGTASAQRHDTTNIEAGDKEEQKERHDHEEAERVVAERMALVDAGLDSRRTSKRLRANKQPTPSIESQGQSSLDRSNESIPSVEFKGIMPSGQRRSNRLSSQGPVKLDVYKTAPPTLPGTWHQDDSILSLNTTASDVSSLPPTNPGNMSVSNLPRWTIPLAKLVDLSSLVSGNESYDGPSSVEDRRTRGTRSGVCVIVCVTAVKSPCLVKSKEDRARGRDGTLWRASWDVVAPTRLGRTGGKGTEVGCEVLFWDKCAEQIGNTVRTGDVVLLQNVEFKTTTTTGQNKPQIVLSSSSLRSPSATVLYRTLPRYDHSPYIRTSPRNKGTEKAKMLLEDHLLRPDLRLGRSDPGIRRVAEFANWFAPWIGGVRPPS